MLTQFFIDLNKAKEAEQLVRQIFAQLTDQYQFVDVSNDKEYYYKGDIKAIAANGKEIYIDVKDDGTIHRTGNVLCEEEVYFKQSGHFGKGNMKSDYDIMAIVSKQEQKIYVIDFNILKQHYKKGEYKEINHPTQVTHCYLCELWRLRKWGALITTIDYSSFDFSEKF